MPALVTQLLSGSFIPGNTVLPPLPVVPGPAVTALWAYLGGSIGASQNMMPSAPAMTIIGAPVFQPNYVSCTPGASPNTIDTNLLDDNKTFSLLAAVRYVGAGGAPVAIPLANNDVTTLFGVSWFLSGTALGLSLNPSANSTVNIPSVANNWKMVGGSFDDVTHISNVYDLTGNTMGTATGTLTRNLSGSHFFIGANPRTSVGTVPMDVAFVGLIKGQAISQAVATQYAANIRANRAAWADGAMTSQMELAQLALTFLHRVDLKGIEARRMVEVQYWLETMLRTAEADIIAGSRATETNNG